MGMVKQEKYITEVKLSTPPEFKTFELKFWALFLFWALGQVSLSHFGSLITFNAAISLCCNAHFSSALFSFLTTANKACIKHIIVFFWDDVTLFCIDMSSCKVDSHIFELYPDSVEFEQTSKPNYLAYIIAHKPSLSFFKIAVYIDAQNSGSHVSMVNMNRVICALINFETCHLLYIDWWFLQILIKLLSFVTTNCKHIKLFEFIILII